MVPLLLARWQWWWQSLNPGPKATIAMALPSYNKVTSAHYSKWFLSYSLGGSGGGRV